MAELFNFNNYFFNWYSVFPVLSGMIIVATGFIILLRNGKSALTWSYFIFTLLIGVWLVGYGVIYSISNQALAEYLNDNFAFLGIITIPANFFFFSSAFVGLNRRRTLLTVLGYILAVFFYILTIKGILLAQPKMFFWGWYPQYIILPSIPFIVFFYTYMVGGFYNFYSAWRNKLASFSRGNIKLLILAFAVAYLASIDHLPAYGIPVYPSGYFFVFIFNSIMAYLVTRRKLLVITPAMAAQKIVDTMAESLIVTDRDFRIEFVNDATANLLRYPKDELVGRSYAEILHDKKYARKEIFVKNIDRGNFVGEDIDYMTKEGKPIPCRVSISSFVDQDKISIGYIIVTSDMSEVRKYIVELQKLKSSLEDKVSLRTAELVEERDKIAAIISNLVDPVIVAGSDGKLSLANEAAAKVLGIGQGAVGSVVVDALGGFSTIGLKPLANIDFIVKENKLEKDGPFIEELIIKTYRRTAQSSNPFLAGKSHYDDRDIVYKVLTVPVHGRNNQYYGMMKIFYNLTREKLLDKMKTEFVSIAAHQLRTPMSAVKWAIKMVADGDAGKINTEQANILMNGYRSNERSIRLVNQMLNVARIEEGKFSYQLSQCGFQEILDAVFDAAKDSLCEAKIKLKTEIAGPLPVLTLDREKIILALENILDNAIKYTPANGTIRFSAATEGSTLVIRIKDNGMGITDEDQPKIFGKFFRGENVVRVQTDGSGLGLFITKSIIEGHKGMIDYLSKEGVGTEFIIKLPIG